MHDECAVADEQLAELALGLLAAEEADEVLAHVEGCARCRAELDELSATADRLLVAAPAAEPPAGFEGRAVARMGGGVARRASWVRRVAAVALLAAGAAAVGVLAGRASAPDRTVLVAASLAPDRAELFMSIDGEQGETYRCSLRSSDGTTTEVARWRLRGDVGRWWVAVPPALRGATEVVVSDAAGREVATAPLR
jgi:hypothetical protein